MKDKSMNDKSMSEEPSMITAEKRQYSLASLTSWHIGGEAERFFRPPHVAALAEYLSTLPQELPITWLGLGSNVLIRDGGIKGAVISMLDLKEIKPQELGLVTATASTPNSELIWVEAGVPCAKFARFCCRRGLSDAAFFAGIPGTIGGALTMNAGAFGGETWEWVKEVALINRAGQCLVRTPEEYNIGYRTVKMRESLQRESLQRESLQRDESLQRESLEQPEAFVGAIFEFIRTDKDGLADIKNLLRKRSASQPIGTFNCGSVYRNPEGDYAARLIEACGLKGRQIGGAQISEKHANFIINIGNARSDDIEQLMSLIESAVLNKFNIALHAEVRILGEKPK